MWMWSLHWCRPWGMATRKKAQRNSAVSLRIHGWRLLRRSPKKKLGSCWGWHDTSAPRSPLSTGPLVVCTVWHSVLVARLMQPLNALYLAEPEIRPTREQRVPQRQPHLVHLSQRRPQCPTSAHHVSIPPSERPDVSRHPPTPANFSPPLPTQITALDSGAIGRSGEGPFAMHPFFRKAWLFLDPRLCVASRAFLQFGTYGRDLKHHLTDLVHHWAMPRVLTPSTPTYLRFIPLCPYVDPWLRASPGFGGSKILHSASHGSTVRMPVEVHGEPAVPVWNLQLITTPRRRSAVSVGSTGTFGTASYKVTYWSNAILKAGPAPFSGICAHPFELRVSEEVPVPLPRRCFSRRTHQVLSRHEVRITYFVGPNVETLFAAQGLSVNGTPGDKLDCNSLPFGQSPRPTTTFHTIVCEPMSTEL
uniref:Uncharacterized protein n=1 Tax=Podospora anserina (strain S / ATCC MYA-4624 / DSM 980 / FGSC 10383) TaxID=515849 RepID=A0A090CB99_PODAN|nr:Putative protein of unknown function [Podospora anserina S mat+]